MTLPAQGRETQHRPGEMAAVQRAAARERNAEAAARRWADHEPQRSIDYAIRIGGRVVTLQIGLVFRRAFGTIVEAGCRR